MQDQVMSIKAARKITQEKVGIYDYSAYGEKVISVNNPITNNIPVAGGIINSLLGTVLPPQTIPQTLQSNPAEEFGYTGREENNGVDGLMYYRNRHYSTKFKSFISEDQIGLAGGMNQYAYVEGNPISYSDPMGLWPTEIHEMLIDMAFPKISFTDRQILKQASSDTDNLIPGQYPSMSYTHGMSFSGQTPTEAALQFAHFTQSKFYLFYICFSIYFWRRLALCLRQHFTSSHWFSRMGFKSY